MARILIVDDENNIRMMVRLALQHVGHTVETASDGPEGLQKFGNGSNYDLILLDQRMPGMEGLDVLKQMRYQHPSAKIIMATAFGTIDLAVDAMKSGATDFLRKPFTAETLRGAVQSALSESSPTPNTEHQTPTARSGVTFGSTTINGFRIEFKAGSGQSVGGGFRQVFTVRSPGGENADCAVELPGYVMELVKAHADCEKLPGNDRFWQALCEEALANHLWQNADLPANGQLRIEDLTTGLRRFVDTVMAA